MGYDCGDSFYFDFEQNGFPFGSENRKENYHHDHIPFNLKGNGMLVFSVNCGGGPRSGREGAEPRLILIRRGDER